MDGYVLGLDGGGTKTLAQAADAAGRPLFRLAGGALNLNSETQEKVRAAVRGLLEQARAQAGPQRRLDAVCIAAAGVSNPAAADVLRAGAADAGFDGPVRVVGDHIAALAGALGRPEGIVLIAGTGSICAGRTADGREARAGGRGHLIDDEGSGYAMGRDVLRAVVQAEDGRGPQTCLTQAVYQALGAEDMGDVVAYVYAPQRTKREIAALAKLLPQAAAQGDEAAHAIYAHAARELAKLAAAVAARLDMPEGPLALAGGALVNDGELRARLEEELRRRCPGLRAVQAAHDAAQGAAVLAAQLAAQRKGENDGGRSEI